MRDLERLDRHLVAGGVEARTGPLGRPAVEEIPAHLLLAGVVEQHDRAVLALDLAVHRLLAPLPQSASSVMPHFSEMLEYLFSPGSLRAVSLSLPSRYSIGSWAESRPEPRGTRPLNAVDLDPEVESAIRIVPIASAMA